MEIKQSQVTLLSHELVKRYQDFFELKQVVPTIDDQPQMQPQQVQFFIQQAFSRHYPVRIQFNVQDHIEQHTGHLIKQVSETTYLMRDYRTNLYKIATLNQIHHVRRVTL